MRRIPNPVSDLNVFLKVFRGIHGILKNREAFGLDDISHAMIAGNNVTSQGAIGDEALRRSTRTNRSRDPIYNQSKMYAELFRTLGWVQSTTKQHLYVFSLLGSHVVAAHNPAPLFLECLLGIAYPNEILKVKGKQRIRVIGGILLVMDVLGSISRDEIIAGPMSIPDDTDNARFQKMINKIDHCRKIPKKLDRILDAIAAKQGILKNSTMKNYTRFPLAALRWSGWGVKKKRGVIHITDAGRAIASKLKNATDIRLSHFNKFPDTAKPAFIRWTFYSMLARAGFNIDPVRTTIDVDSKHLNAHGLPSNGDVFFSPFQQISLDTIQKLTPELILSAGTVADKQTKKSVEKMLGGCVHRERTPLIFEFSDRSMTTDEQTSDLLDEIYHVLQHNKDVDAATDILSSRYLSADKDIFYPLVVEIFCMLGFNCRMSRGGQHYERADAIILDQQKSIPIEIKSPREETEISVKGVRQALENKIVLLSRKSYSTDTETTSLVVGFNPPNERSEVHELIEDIYKTFNIRVGVIDFKSLLSLAVHSAKNKKNINIHDFRSLQGVIRVKYLAPKR